MKHFVMDAPNALGFVVSQRSHIETEVLRKPYPEFKYAKLVPVDTSANPFAASVTHFTQDAVGRAKIINGKGDDVPFVNINGSKFEQMVNMGGVGYSFSMEEIGAASQMGTNLSNEGAMAARMAYEMLVDEMTLVGDAGLGIQGLFNTTGITTIAAGATFAASTPDTIIAAINGALSAIEVGTLGTQVANTIVLPLSVSAVMVRRLGDGSDVTIGDFVARANAYTSRTGLPLTIEYSHRLTTSMVVYKRDPSVLKMHMPMPLQFIPPQFVNLEVKVLGMFRFAPVSIRMPTAMRYVTGVAV